MRGCQSSPSICSWRAWVKAAARASRSAKVMSSRPGLAAPGFASLREQFLAAVDQVVNVSAVDHFERDDPVGEQRSVRPVRVDDLFCERAQLVVPAELLLLHFCAASLSMRARSDARERRRV